MSPNEEVGQSKARKIVLSQLGKEWVLEETHKIQQVKRHLSMNGELSNGELNQQVSLDRRWTFEKMEKLQPFLINETVCIGDGRSDAVCFRDYLGREIVNQNVDKEDSR
jgi:hypothetical protein